MSAPGDEVQRLFFAAVPAPETRAQITAAAQALPAAAGAQCVPRENYHLTLAFVGMISAELVSVLREIGGAQRGDSFTLRFDTYEYWAKPQAVVVTAGVIPPALEQLWHRLHATLAVQQWALQPKRLRPHISLARKIAQAPVLPAMPAFDWTVCEFSLMRSEAHGVHPAYTVVDTWPLLDDSAKTSKNSVI